jgi:hypothetical protein
MISPNNTTRPEGGHLVRLAVRYVAALALLAQSPVALAQATQPTVVHLPLVGSVEHGLNQQISHALDAARSSGANAVILDLDLDGGEFAAAQLAIDPLLDSPVPVYALIREKAWLAGALIALAADSIFMAPGSSIGAGPSPAETDLSASAVRQLASEFRIVATSRGRDNQLAAAMVDPAIAIEGVVAAGEWLTLSTPAAISRGIAAGRARNLDQLLEIVGLAGAEIVPFAAEAAAAYAGTTVTVSNQNWRDIRVYLLHGSQGSMRTRLGTVTSMNSTEYEIPPQLSVPGSRIQVLAEVIGSSERAVTEQVTVQPGLVIEWIIANVISQSNYFIFIRN